MFRLLHYFSITSAVAIIAVTVTLTFIYWQNATHSLTKHIEHQNVKLAKSIANTIWPKYGKYVKAIPNLGGEVLRELPETRKIHESLKAMTAGVEVLKVKMYNLDGLTVYSSEFSEIGGSKRADEGFKKTVRLGQPSTKSSYRETFQSFDGVVTNRHLIESYLPVSGVGGQLEGVFELYTDVTHQITEIRKNTIIIVAYLLLSLAALYFVLFLIIRHADHIMRRQYANLSHEITKRQAIEDQLKSNDIERQKVIESLEISQAELQEKSGVLQATLNSIDEGFAAWDSEHRLIVWNSKCLDFWYNYEGVRVGMPRRDLIRYIALKGGFGPGDPDDLAEVNFKRIIATGPRSQERFSLLDGRIISLKRYPMPDGKHASVYSDISDRLKAEKELENTEQTLLNVVQASPVAVGITDSDGRFQFWNPLFYDMGRKVENDKGRSEFRLSFKDPDLYAKLHEILERDGIVRNYEVELFDERGEPNWGLVSMQSMVFESENATLTWVYDITELKSQAAALTEARVIAEDASRSKSDFLAQMSHEIRTPMNGVMSMADLLALTPLTREQAGMNKVIGESSRALLTIINDILDFSKIEAGKIDIEKASFSVTAVVEGMVELLAASAYDKGLDLVVYIDPETPDHLEGDSGRLRQVLTNLLSNAIKFTTDGRIAVNVNLAEASEETVTLRFTFTDSGIGLTEEQISKLFQPFQQADTSITRRFGGTGLGLTISRKLANLMGGDIEVKSLPGDGATFTLELPFAVKPEKRSIMNYDLSGIYVLIVGSSSSTCEPLKRYLEFLNAQCTITNSYEEAVDAVRKGKQANRGVSVIVNHDAPCDVFCASALECIGTENEFENIPLVCAGLKPGEDYFESEKDDHNVITVSRPHKREIICRTIAEAVGRAVDSKKVHESDRADDDPMNTVYLAPSNEVAAENGTLILVAEDNATNQTVIKLLMAKLGFAAEIASNGAEALKKLEEKTYGLLLTDCHMPEMDGYQLAAEVRRRETMTEKRLPIIALTADALTGTAKRCLDVGMDDCLTKPVERSLLNQTICKWLPGVSELRSPVEEGRGLPEAPYMKSEDELQVLDLSYFRELVGGADEMVAELLVEYIDTTRPLVEQLLAALKGREYESARKAAHAIAGSSKTAGAMELAEICGTIERTVAEQGYDMAMAHSASLEPAFERVAEEVNSL